MTNKNTVPQLPAELPGHWTTAAGHEMAQRGVKLQRSALVFGEASDFDLAHRCGMADGRTHEDNVTFMAAKDRIRWLSVQLALAEMRAPTPPPAVTDALMVEALTMTGCRDASELIDMANVGQSLMNRIGELTRCTGNLAKWAAWAPADDPAEIVNDLANALDDALAEGEKPAPGGDPVAMSMEDIARRLNPLAFVRSSDETEAEKQEGEKLRGRARHAANTLLTSEKPEFKAFLASLYAAPTPPTAGGWKPDREQAVALIAEEIRDGITTDIHHDLQGVERVAELAADAVLALPPAFDGDPT